MLINGSEARVLLPEAARCRHCGASEGERHVGFCPDFQTDRRVILDRDGHCACCGEAPMRDGSCFIDCEIEQVTETNVPFLWCSKHEELPTEGARKPRYDRLTRRWA